MGAKLKLAVVGAGQIAHIACRELALHPDARVVAAADPHAARLAELRETFAIEHGASDGALLFERDDVDAVYIATPNAFHAPLAVAALERGKHVLLEKPFAMSFTEAKRVADAASLHGRLLTLNMAQRFRADSQLVRGLTLRGDLGDVYHAKAYWFRRSGIPKLGTWFGKKALSGGGALLDIGVHLLDLALFAMDNFRPVSVSGCTYSRFGHRGLGEGGWSFSERSDGAFDVDDFATALVRFENGASLTLDASWAIHQPESDRQNVIVHGSEAGAGCYPAELYRFGAGGADYLVTPAPELPLPFAHQSAFHNFVNAALGREPACVSTAQALVVQRILDAIYESSTSGGEVSLSVD